jgi:hypothetical protein
MEYKEKVQPLNYYFIDPNTEYSRAKVRTGGSKSPGIIKLEKL